MGRIINAIFDGNIELLEVLFDCGLLEPTDTFDLTGHDGHGDTCCDNGDTVGLLHIVANRPCPDYRELIDLMIKNGVNLNEANPITPLEEAIINRNYPTARYLQSKGGTYRNEYIGRQPLEEYRLDIV
jgi:ankyrin repeat protein